MSSCLPSQKSPVINPPVNTLTTSDWVEGAGWRRVSGMLHQLLHSYIHISCAEGGEVSSRCGGGQSEAGLLSIMCLYSFTHLTHNQLHQVGGSGRCSASTENRSKVTVRHAGPWSDVPGPRSHAGLKRWSSVRCRSKIVSAAYEKQTRKST